MQVLSASSPGGSVQWKCSRTGRGASVVLPHATCYPNSWAWSAYSGPWPTDASIVGSISAYSPAPDFGILSVDASYSAAFSTGTSKWIAARDKSPFYGQLGASMHEVSLTTSFYPCLATQQCRSKGGGVYSSPFAYIES